MAIVNSLQADDSLDEAEFRSVSNNLFKLINAAVELARLVQDTFGSAELAAAEARSLVPVGAVMPAAPARKPAHKKPD